MTLSDGTLATAAINDLKPSSRGPGHPRKDPNAKVSIPPHLSGPVDAKVTLDEDIQKEIALYCLAYEENFGRAPSEDYLLRDLINRGIRSDENFRKWKKAKRQELREQSVSTSRKATK